MQATLEGSNKTSSGSLCNPYRVDNISCPRTQGALRDPGLWSGTPLGYTVRCFACTRSSWELLKLGITALESLSPKSIVDIFQAAQLVE